MNTTVSSVHIQYCRKKTLAMVHKHTSIMTCMHFIINIYTQSCIFNMTYGLSHKTFELNSPLFMYGQGLHVVVILCMVNFSCILINILLMTFDVKPLTYIVLLFRPGMDRDWLPFYGRVKHLLLCWGVESS